MTIAIVVAILLVLAVLKFLPVFAIAWAGVLLALGLGAMVLRKEFGTPMQLACATLLSLPLGAAWIVYHI